MLPGMGDGLGAFTAVIVAGPPSIFDIKTTDGGPPWYVSTAFTPRRFDVADLRVLFGEWAESESASASRVEDAVLEGVIALTQAHRGWTMKLAGP